MRVVKAETERLRTPGRTPCRFGSGLCPCFLGTIRRNARHPIFSCFTPKQLRSAALRLEVASLNACWGEVSADWPVCCPCAPLVVRRNARIIMFYYFTRSRCDASLDAPRYSVNLKLYSRSPQSIPSRCRNDLVNQEMTTHRKHGLSFSPLPRPPSSSPHPTACYTRTTMSLLALPVVSFDEHVGVLILEYSTLILGHEASRRWIRSHEPQAWFDLCATFYFQIARGIIFDLRIFGHVQRRQALSFLRGARTGPLRLSSYVRYLYLDTAVDLR